MNNTKKWPCRLLTLALGFSTLLISAPGHAQKMGPGQKVDSTAKKVGNATASIAVKGASAVTDKVYKGKQGPKGETVYINKNDRKYIVNSKGKKVYLKSSQIKDKKKE
jgi:hypothetical protein